MEYIQLGKSDLYVSRICLGCMGFGNASQNDGKTVAGRHSWTLDEEASRKIIKHALDVGINFFDTAAIYQEGSSEQFIGRALNDFANREEIVVATKFMPRTKIEKEAGLSGKDFVLKRINESLENLQMDYIDLYIMHMWDEETPFEEIMEGLNEAYHLGKIRYIGMSNCYAYQLAKINTYAKSKGYPQFISMQNHYNLLYREDEREINRYCQEENIVLTPYSSLASGRLSKRPGEISKRLKEDQFAKSKYDDTKYIDQDIINRVIHLADQYNVEMTQISLAWLLTKVSAPIIGATKLYHIDEAIKALDIKLTQDDIDYLEELYVPHKLNGTMLMIKQKQS